MVPSTQVQIRKDIVNNDIEKAINFQPPSIQAYRHLQEITKSSRLTVVSRAAKQVGCVTLSCVIYITCV